MEYILDNETFRIDGDLYTVTGPVDINWHDGVAIPDVQLQDLQIIKTDRWDRESVFDPTECTRGVVMLLISYIFKQAEEYAYDEGEPAEIVSDMAYDSRNDR